MDFLLAEWADAYSYIALLMALMVVNLLPPVPAEMVIPFSATLFDDPTLSLPMAIVMATIGLVLGTLPLYYLGRSLGEERLKAFLQRHRRWLAVTPKDIDRSGRWFRRYGAWLVLAGRLIPGMRSMVSIPAGFHCMPLPTFLLSTIIGSAAWASLLVLAGHWLSHALPGVTAARILLVLIGVFLAFYIYRVIRLTPAADPTVHKKTRAK